ncbi:MAG: hypothetical protein GY943_32740 [Chloroflexi bacterium]|nr:hypothetical protein [Chloroflexota bacterium]
MTELKHPSKIRLIEPLLTLLAFGVAAIYLLNVFNTGNWFWFKGTTTEINPSRIVIVENGTRTLLQPGTPNFNLIADATKQSLSKFSNTDLISVGLSDQTMADYETESLIVEIYFDNPVQFNTLARTGEPTQLLIPIDGRHANGRYVFRGDKGEWWFGAIRMADPTALYQALEQMGFTASIFEMTS